MKNAPPQSNSPSNKQAGSAPDVNGCQETLFSGCEGAVSSVGGVLSGVPCMPMLGRHPGGQASACGLAGLTSLSGG